MSLLDRHFLHDFPDRAIRKLLEHPANLRDLVIAVAPDLGRQLDFTTLEPVQPREFLLDDWRSRESDLLFRVPLRGRRGHPGTLVCVLVEHQSQADPRMPLRMLLYAVLYWEQEWKQWETQWETRSGRHARGERTPLRITPVLPIVFHTGSSPWQAARELPDLVEGPEALKRLAPHWPLFLWDLAERTPRELLQQASDWFRALAVVRAERAERKEFQAIYQEALHGLEALAEQERMRWIDLVHFIISWALRRRPSEEENELRRLAVESQASRKRKREMEKMSETVSQTWEEWVLERGMTEGLAKGRAEGQIAACRENLLALLENRFGNVPARLVKKIKSTADLAKLKSAFQQALSIESLDELPL
jgi:hypothetical protein